MIIAASTRNRRRANRSYYRRHRVGLFRVNFPIRWAEGRELECRSPIIYLDVHRSVIVKAISAFNRVRPNIRIEVILHLLYCNTFPTLDPEGLPPKTCVMFLTSRAVYTMQRCERLSGSNI